MKRGKDGLAPLLNQVMPKVWLIRHGESESNADLRTSHPSETTLTPKGLIEAERVAGRFVEAPDLIVVSPYLRSRQTAEPTLQRFAEIAIEEWPVHEFTYLHPNRYRDTMGSERMPHI